MVNLMAAIGLGFVLGMRHATDPDHVIAVTTIVCRQRNIRQAGVIGALWGVGHTVTIFAVGAAIILFDVSIPPRLGLTMELVVGLMLMLLGVLSLTGVTQRLAEHSHGDMGADGAAHAHLHGERTRTRPHGEPGNALQRGQRLGVYQFLRPLAVGLVHGLAGSAAVALLVLAEIRDPRWAIAYLLVFGVGTIAGMMLITMTIGAPFAYTRRRFQHFHRRLGIACGALSLVFGLFITFHIAIVDGLFAAHPHWTPQ